jgi:hypothetical protein
MGNYHLKKTIIIMDSEGTEKFKILNVKLMQHLSFTSNWIFDYC